MQTIKIIVNYSFLRREAIVCLLVGGVASLINITVVLTLILSKGFYVSFER